MFLIRISFVSFQVLFITFGVFGFIPTCHYILRFGVEHAFTSRIYLIEDIHHFLIEFLFQLVPHIIYLSSVHSTRSVLVSMLVKFISNLI